MDNLTLRILLVSALGEDGWGSFLIAAAWLRALTHADTRRGLDFEFASAPDNGHRPFPSNRVASLKVDVPQVIKAIETAHAKSGPCRNAIVVTTGFGPSSTLVVARVSLLWQAPRVTHAAISSTNPGRGFICSLSDT